MGSRFPSHQISNGLYISGQPEQPKEKPPTIHSTAMPYTGGDIKKSGAFQKIFDLNVQKPRKYGSLTNVPSRNLEVLLPSQCLSCLMPLVILAYAAPGSGSSLVAGGFGRQKSGPPRHWDSVKKSSGPQSGVVTPMAQKNSGPLPPALPATGLITCGLISSGPLNSSGASC